MKKKVLLVLSGFRLGLLIVLISCSFKLLCQEVPGLTGSPHDGKNCTECHPVTATTLNNIVTSNIGAIGYTPNDTYNFTLTLSNPSKIQCGFEVSPQNAAGSFFGKLLPGTGTVLSSGNSNYITQSSAYTTNPACWSFKWVAPAKGSGIVTFYGAFAVGGESDAAYVYLSADTVKENTTAGIDVSTKDIIEINIYPNPVIEKFNVSYSLTKSENVSINLYSCDGKQVIGLLNEYQKSGNYNTIFSVPQELPIGVYLLKMQEGDYIKTIKVFKE